MKNSTVMSSDVSSEDKLMKNYGYFPPCPLGRQTYENFSLFFHILSWL